MSRFSDNILIAARRLKDERTLAIDNTMRFTSQRLVDYENRAIRDLVKELYGIYKDNFGDILPEMVKTSAAISIGTGIKIARPIDCWLVLSVKNEAGTVLYSRLKDQDVELVRTGRHGLIIPTANNPRFWQEEDYIYLLPSTLTGKIIPRYIIYHSTISLSDVPSPVIKLADYWDGDIVDRMVKLANEDLK